MKQIIFIQFLNVRKPCPKWVQISIRTDNDSTDHVTVMTLACVKSHKLQNFAVQDQYKYRCKQ